MLSTTWLISRTLHDFFHAPRHASVPPAHPAHQQCLSAERQQQQQQQNTSSQQQQHQESSSAASREPLKPGIEAKSASRVEGGRKSGVPVPVSAITAKQSQPVSQSASKPQGAPPADQPESESKKSEATLVLKPSVSGNRMSFKWAEEQVEKYKYDFDEADKDKSGTLSFAEVFAILKNVGFNGSEEEAKFIFGHMDRDRDQSITRPEFHAAVEKLPKLTIKEFALRKIFKQLDKDNSGFLSREEIADATKAGTGVNLSAQKIADLLNAHCRDTDGKINYEEYLEALGVEQEATVLHQIFKKMDADNSGFLSRDEIANAVSSESELNIKAEKISALLIQWCKDDDQKLNYDEFVQAWLEEGKKKKKSK